MRVISRLHSSCSHGFTLAEVLIALALLGVVAAFSIPKVMQAVGQQDAKSKLAETAALLEEVVNESRLQGNFSNYFVNSGGSNYYISLYPSLESRANALQKFPGSLAEEHPCKYRSPEGGPSTLANSHILLPNGVLIGSLSQTSAFYSTSAIQLLQQSGMSGYNHVLCIDINNYNGPNQPGQDIFVGNFNLSGDFDVNTGTAFTPKFGGKAFHWGSKSQAVYDYVGAPLPGAYGDPTSRVGYYLGH